jgi:hypothetical protein
MGDKIKMNLRKAGCKDEIVSESCPMADCGISNNRVGFAITGLGDWLLLKTVVSETEFVIGVSYTFKSFYTFQTF